MKILKTSSLLLMLAVTLVLTFNACKKEKKEDEITPENSFDKSGMLANIGDNIIVQAYANLKISVDSLQVATAQFNATPTLASLADLQTKFFQVYKNYQWCSTFQFGPAENEYVRSSFNTFPCDTLQINSKISAGDYTLAAATDLDAKGLPAIDYLLHRSDQDNNIVLARFTTDANAASTRNYLSALITEIKSKTDIVNNGWSATGGNYISTFKGNTGNDIGGSIGILVNELNYDLELLKNAKIGIPLGKKTLGVPQPVKVEALYSAQSLALAAEHLKSIENIYLGRDAQNNNRLGFDDYLVQIGSASLNDAINNKFNLAKTKLAMIPGILSDAVVSNPSTVDAAYLELQQLVIFLKVDMPSALGVSITYVDNDGD